MLILRLDSRGWLTLLCKVCATLMRSLSAFLSAHLIFCLSVRPYGSVCRPVCLYVYLACLPFCQIPAFLEYIGLSVCWSVCLSVYLSVYWSVGLYVCLSVCVPRCLRNCVPACHSIRMSVYLCFCKATPCSWAKTELIGSYPYLIFLRYSHLRVSNKLCTFFANNWRRTRGGKGRWCHLKRT